ncbi:MAG: AEC family transporter [Parvularcula sp.]|jgi:predicted permease|nr:AEC family transporter [Parvularcula sp.]
MPGLVSILTPLFGAIFIGAGTRRFKLFDGEDARRISRFVFMVAMPIAGFDFMRRADLPADVFFGVVGAYLLSLTVASTAAFLIARTVLGLTIRETGAAIFTVTCGNAIFLGIPIALSVPAWAPTFLLLLLFEGTFVFATGTALMTWPEAGDETEGSALGNVLRTLRQALARSLTNPIVVGTLLGLVAGQAPIAFPAPIEDLFAFMARVAGPLGLFILGVSVMNLLEERGIGEIRPLLFLLPIKLLLFPGLTGLLTWQFTGGAAGPTAAAILFTGLPPAVASVVLSQVYRQWITGVAGLVAAGTLVGLVTLALFLSVALPS